MGFRYYKIEICGKNSIPLIDFLYFQCTISTCWKIYTFYYKKNFKIFTYLWKAASLSNYTILATALGSHCSLRCIRRHNLLEVGDQEIPQFENCHLANCHLGSHPWENAFGKIPNTSENVLYSNPFQCALSILPQKCFLLYFGILTLPI